MCINFDPPSKAQLMQRFDVEPPASEWKSEVWQDYSAPILISNGGHRIALDSTYGFVPKDKQPPNIRLTTMNARAETVGELKTYKRAWAISHLCLVPLTGFYEPNYESGKAVRWRIKLTDDQPFAVAGIYRSWDEDTDNPRHSFTQLTVNADDHPFMSRFHKPGDEKRSLVILPENDWDEWLNCRNPEFARTFLQPFPPELLTGEAKPLSPRQKNPVLQQDFFG